MKKSFVLDTNTLLHTPQAMFVFEDNDVVIPLAVLEEIDGQKRRQDEIGRNAREVSRILDDLRTKGDLSRGVPLPDGGTVRVEVNHTNWDELPSSLEVLDAGKPDNRILAVALNLCRGGRNGEVILVSKDLNLRVKADVLGVEAQDLNNDKVDFESLYSGQCEVHVTKAELDLFYQERKLAQNGRLSLLPNQFAVLKCLENPSTSGLARVLDHTLWPLAVQSFPDCFGVRPRNKEQIFALDLLLDERTRIVTLAGGAGTGKTLLALAAGLDQVLERNLYDRLLVTRPVIPLDGQDLGFLPGDKEEKIRPWMQPIFDNLEYLFRASHSHYVAAAREKMDRPPRNGDILDIESYLAFSGRIELEALSYIRGRSLARKFILVDEAQNCTPHAIKTMLTRVGEGSKIVFTGDVGQIDHPYLDPSSNGLTQLIEKIKHSHLSGHVTLYKGERSEVAELGAKLL
ncbi:MAG: PhoH family protein [Thermodesulfobacteriota bacterium]